MKHLASIALPLLLLAACTPAPGTGGSSSSSSSVAPQGPISVDSPHANELVTSPLTVTGTARGMWYFEAVFPVKLVDDQGNMLVETHADAQGDWMTEDFVPFKATLTFTTTAERGKLILQKDNPSGMPENDASIEVPVRFK